MDTVRLGRTGLEVSVAGLGCGGPSRLGRTAGRTEAEQETVVRAALDGGVTFFDTSEMYGTEEVVGRALSSHRDDVVICTKGYWRGDDGPITAEHLENKLNASLRRLGTDHVDVYLIHALTMDGYHHVTAELVPALERLRDAGKTRWIGCSEMFGGDTAHQALQTALADDWIDVCMVGYSLLNPSAADTVFPLTLERDVGTLIMFAVRRALSDPANLRETLEGVRDRLPDDLDLDDALAFLLQDAATVPEAAYRFCRHTPGADVILTGTGSTDHLTENLKSIQGPPLSPASLDRLSHLFGGLDVLSGN